MLAALIGGPGTPAWWPCSLLDVKALKRCASLLSPGAPQVAWDRDWRSDCQTSRKPEHLSFSRSLPGRAVVLGPVTELRSCAVSP